MGKYTILMVILNSYVKLPEGNSRHKLAKYNNLSIDNLFPKILIFPSVQIGLGQHNQPPKIGDWMLKATAFVRVPEKNGAVPPYSTKLPSGGFQKWGYPKIIHYNRFIPLETIHFGDPAWIGNSHLNIQSTQCPATFEPHQAWRTLPEHVLVLVMLRWSNRKQWKMWKQSHLERDFPRLSQR